MNAVEGLALRPTEEDKTKKIRRKLDQKKIPAENWHFYIETPESWDFDDIAPSGLQRGIEVVLLSPNTTSPGWLEQGSEESFIKIRGKLTEIIQAKAEIDRFVKEEIPEGNQLVASHKQASKKADKLKADLQSASNELAAMTYK